MWEDLQMESERLHTELRCAVNSWESHFSTLWRWEAWALLSLYTCDQTRPPLSLVLDATLEIWFPCQAWWPLPTHTRFCYYNTRKSNSGCSRSRSENKVRHISVTHQRSFGKKHSQNCCGWMWIQREGVKAASEQEYPNAWNSTACKQLLTENTQKYCAVIGQFDGTLKRALRLAEVHLMFAFSLFSDTSIPVQPNSTGAGAFIPYTISPHRRGVPLLQPITENYRNAFAISTISSFHTTSCFSHLICSSIITLYCT